MNGVKLKLSTMDKNYNLIKLQTSFNAFVFAQSGDNSQFDFNL